MRIEVLFAQMAPKFCTLILAAFALVSFAGSPAQAQSFQCSQLFEAPTFPIQKDYLRRFNSFFYENLTGGSPDKHIKFIWSLPYPPYVKYQAGGAVRFEFNGKRGRDFVGQPWEKDVPLVGIGRMIVTTHVDSDKFYERVYSNYAPEVRARLVALLNRVDSELEYGRVSLGLIGNGSTFRVYDASERPFGWQFLPNMTNPDVGGTALPFQRLNRLRGLKALPAEAFLKKEIANGRKVMELSKFSLNGTPEERRRSRNLIEAFWYKHIAEPYPDAIFVAQAVSAAAARHYHQRYGFEIAEAYDVPGSAEKEYILWVTGKTLTSKLRGHIGLEDREVISSDPNVPSRLPPPLPLPNKSAFAH